MDAKTGKILKMLCLAFAVQTACLSSLLAGQRVFAVQADGHGKYIFHTIERKETLYGLSKKFGVRVQDILSANPGLTIDTFQEGKEIRIPAETAGQKPEMVQTYKMHSVQKGETVFSISQQYNISLDAFYTANPGVKTSGLKKGSLVKIVQLTEKKMTESDLRTQEDKAEKALRDRTKIKALETVKVGLLFPFLDQEDGQSARFTEYVRGFLMAVEDFKQAGHSAEVYVFGIDAGGGTDRLRSLLETAEFRSLNILVGGVSPDQVSVLADFAKKEDIKYVVPFTSKNDEVLSNGNLFQVNTPHVYLYPLIAQVFAQRFAGANVVFADEAEGDKADFVNVLKTELRKAKISTATVTLTDDGAPLMAAAMRADKTNIIVPASGSAVSAAKLAVLMQAVRTNKPELRFSLFGYPEWQTYNSQIQADLHKLDSYFYSPFYAGQGQAKMQAFAQEYKNRFGKSLMNIFPKYGALGYDTANYFLNAAWTYGANFEANIGKYRAASIQSALSFDRVNNWGGFINKGFYFVHYGVSTTEKTEYDK